MTTATMVQGQAVVTYELGSYFIDLVKIEYFREYYNNNLANFSKVALNSYLKALDIPPKFFKEQPEETQEELLDNREIFVKEHKKYLDKVIVVARCKRDDCIVNACRMVEADAKASYENLKSIDEVENKFEHRSFIKDNYITYVISDKLENNKENKVLVIDFPITLNKKTVIHEALYSLPNETFATPIEHIQYLTSDEVDFEFDYKEIKVAIEDKLNFLTDELEEKEDKEILREPDVVSLAVNYAGILPNSYTLKFETYIRENLKGALTTKKLESLILDYDETFRGYKQVRALREANGSYVLEILESEKFKEQLEELEKLTDDLK